MEIASRSEYYALGERLRAIGLRECEEKDAPLCRWKYQDLLVDIMPCDEGILGFSNCWYKEAIANKLSYSLPSGRDIWIFPPIYLLASKIEAFLGRGKDFRFSKDIEDIVTLLDGCEELEQQFHQAQENIKIFISDWFRENRDSLEESVLTFLVSSSRDREELAFELIRHFLQ